VSVPAVPPQKASSPRIALNTLLAAALGLMVGIFWVFLQDWWQNAK
jgi:uncharacterized protein involved in exopolysaccharide biosynthesis